MVLDWDCCLLPNSALVFSTQLKHALVKHALQ
jgi:hypothetical protein